MSGRWAWSAEGFVQKAKGAASAAGQAFENSGTGQRFTTKLNDWLTEGEEEYVPGQGFQPTAAAQQGAARKAAQSGGGQSGGGQAASGGRNKPLPKKSGGGAKKPGSDDEINQFREWQGQQSSGAGFGMYLANTDAFGGIKIGDEGRQYNFHKVAPRNGANWRRDNGEVGEDRGEDTRPSTVEGGKVDMTPKDANDDDWMSDDDWSASEKTFTPDDLPVGNYTPPNTGANEWTPDMPLHGPGKRVDL